MELFQQAVRDYHIVLETTAGCGTRGDEYIRDAHKEIEDAYEKLPEKQRQNVRVPKLLACDDDGTGGFATGLASMKHAFF